MPEDSIAVPAKTYQWLEEQCLKDSAASRPRWARLARAGAGRRAVQVTNYVGVIRTPDGHQIEVLPKIGRDALGSEQGSRKLLIDMLRCLREFRHMRTESAHLKATRMPLLEVFISEFLAAVTHVVKRGLRGDYSLRQDNLFALRGKLNIATHLRKNLTRADRFFTEHDEFTPDRPENRLIRAALDQVLNTTITPENQRLGRELQFAFAEIPASSQPALDFQRSRADRGMAHYEDALSWTRLILSGFSPLTGSGDEKALSLLFPMESVFEAFVAKHLTKQIQDGFGLKQQANNRYLVRHREQGWFQLRPDLLILERSSNSAKIALDTKWKILDETLGNRKDKYCLSQSDFYQLHAYGTHYLHENGTLILVYPRTDRFQQPLGEFRFEGSDRKLWVLPFCLSKRRLVTAVSESAPQLTGLTPWPPTA